MKNKKNKYQASLVDLWSAKRLRWAIELLLLLVLFRKWEKLEFFFFNSVTKRFDIQKLFHDVLFILKKFHGVFFGYFISVSSSLEFILLTSECPRNLISQKSTSRSKSKWWWWIECRSNLTERKISSQNYKWELTDTIKNKNKIFKVGKSKKRKIFNHSRIFCAWFC